MPTDPEILPSDAAIGAADIDYAGTVMQRRPPRTVPNLAHLLLFGGFVLLAFVAVGVLFGFSLHFVATHLHESMDAMKNDPRLIVPIEAIAYALAIGAAMAVFPSMWQRSFASGVRWNGSGALRYWWILVVIGVVTSGVVQFLSNFLPIPKELPIDKLFTQRAGVWLIAIFGVTVAPAFEELAFRGFLLPSMANAWDWIMQRNRRAEAPANPAEMPWEPSGLTAPQTSISQGDPQWSIGALIFATVITSIGFTLMHGAQLAHSLAPLSVLFVVSLVLCLTRLRFHSLAASTLVHSMYNATIFAMLFVGTDGFRHLDKLNK